MLPILQRLKFYSILFCNSVLSTLKKKPDCKRSGALVNTYGNGFPRILLNRSLAIRWSLWGYNSL